MIAITEAMLMGGIPEGGKFDIGVFSTGRRAGAGLADYCNKFLIEVGLKENIIRGNQETIWIAAGPDPKRSGAPKVVLSFYPGNATGYVIFPLFPIYIYLSLCLSLFRSLSFPLPSLLSFPLSLSLSFIFPVPQYDHHTFVIRAY